MKAPKHNNKAPDTPPKMMPTTAEVTLTSHKGTQDTPSKIKCYVRCASVFVCVRAQSDLPTNKTHTHTHTHKHTHIQTQTSQAVVAFARKNSFICERCNWGFRDRCGRDPTLSFERDRLRLAEKAPFREMCCLYTLYIILTQNE